MKTLLRVSSAVLAVAAAAVTFVRIYAVTGETGPVPGGPTLYAMKILFPATLAAFFGYLAIKGRLPFYRRPGEEDDPGRRSS